MVVEMQQQSAGRGLQVILRSPLQVSVCMCVWVGRCGYVCVCVGVDMCVVDVNTGCVAIWWQKSHKRACVTKYCAYATCTDIKTHIYYI